MSDFSTIDWVVAVAAVMIAVFIMAMKVGLERAKQLRRKALDDRPGDIREERGGGEKKSP